jgi:hypothetical protein
MQSVDGITRDGWPHELVIAIEVNERVLTELLFVRAAWGLDVASTIPEAEPAPASTLNLTSTCRCLKLRRGAASRRSHPSYTDPALFAAVATSAIHPDYYPGVVSARTST